MQSIYISLNDFKPRASVDSYYYKKCATFIGGKATETTVSSSDCIQACQVIFPPINYTKANHITAWWSSRMILGLDITVYNFQEVLGSIPSQALFSFILPSQIYGESCFTIEQIQDSTIPDCLQLFGRGGVCTIFGNIRHSPSHYSNRDLHRLEHSFDNVVLHVDFPRLGRLSHHLPLTICYL